MCELALEQLPPSPDRPERITIDEEYRRSRSHQISPTGADFIQQRLIDTRFRGVRRLRVINHLSSRCTGENQAETNYEKKSSPMIHLLPPADLYRSASVTCPFSAALHQRLQADQDRAILLFRQVKFSQGRSVRHLLRSLPQQLLPLLQLHEVHLALALFAPGTSRPRLPDDHCPFRLNRDSRSPFQAHSIPRLPVV
jgi:hypothetical protein